MFSNDYQSQQLLMHSLLTQISCKTAFKKISKVKRTKKAQNASSPTSIGRCMKMDLNLHENESQLETQECGQVICDADSVDDVIATPTKAMMPTPTVGRSLATTPTKEMMATPTARRTPTSAMLPMPIALATAKADFGKDADADNDTDNDADSDADADSGNDATNFYSGATKTQIPNRSK